MSPYEFMVGICATVGAFAISIFILHVLLDLWRSLCDWLRIKRFVWMTKWGACITEQELEDMSFFEANEWWKGHRNERCWNRFDDYRAGMLAASKAILRQRGIHVVKNGARRKAAPPEAKERGRP